MIVIPMKEIPSISIRELYTKQVETFHSKSGKSSGKLVEHSTSQKTQSPENLDLSRKTQSGKLVESSTPKVETFHSIKKSSTSLKILQKGQRQILETNALKLYFSSLISDISLFLTDSAGKVLSDEWFLYYNQRVSPDQAIHYLEDNVINVNLTRLNERVQKVIITLTSDDGSIPSTELILKTDSNEAFLLSIDGNPKGSIIVCEIYRKNGQWRVYAANQLTTETLYDFCMQYGVQVSD